MADDSHEDVPVAAPGSSPRRADGERPRVHARSEGDQAPTGTRWREGVARQARTVYESAYGNPISDEARGVRWSLTPRVAATVCLALLIGGGVLMWALRAPVGSLLSDGGAGGAPAGSSSSSASPLADVTSSITPWEAGDSEVVVVDVAGHVADPGIRELANGARVADAIEAAGGLLPDAAADGPNLARVLVDGEQVYVPGVDDEVGTGAGTGSVAGESKINVNRSDAAALEELPGVGPVLAERIVGYREEHGPFATVESMDEVSGIGPAMLAQLTEVATV